MAISQVAAQSCWRAVQDTTKKSPTLPRLGFFFGIVGVPGLGAEINASLFLPQTPNIGESPMWSVVSFLMAKTGRTPIYEYPVSVIILAGVGSTGDDEECIGQKMKSLDEVTYTCYFSERQVPLGVCRSSSTLCER